MMSFTLSCEDYEEAEYVFTEFAETCRKIRGTLAKRPRKTATSAQAIELATAPERWVGKSPDLAAPYTNGHAEHEKGSAVDIIASTDPYKAVADAIGMTEPAPKKRGRPAGSKNKGEAVGTQYAPTEKIAEKQTVVVTPPKTVGIDELRVLAEGIVHDKKPGAIPKISAVWKHYQIKRVSDLKPEQYAEVYRKLQAIALGDEIPF